MTPENPFDRDAARLAHRYEAAPTDHAWAAIAARLPHEPGRRLALWWWSAGAATLLALAALTAAWWWDSAAVPAAVPTVPTVSDPVATSAPQPSGQRATPPPINPGSVVVAPPKPKAPSLSRTPRPDTRPLSPALTPTATELEDAPAAESISHPPAPSRTLASLGTPGLHAVRVERPGVLRGPGIPCADFGTRGSWALGLRGFAGAGPSGRSLDTDDTRPAYFLLRDSTERRQLSVHAGLRVEAVHTNGLFVRAGIDYAMQRSRLDLLGATRVDTALTQVRNPVTGAVIRVDTTTTITETSTVVHNRHQTLGFTGGLGFRKTFGAVSPYVVGEAGLELLLATRGKLISPAEELVDLADDERGWITERPGLYYGGTVGVDVALNDRLELGLSGHYDRRGRLSGIADPLRDERTALYGALNVRYRLE